MSYPLVCAPEKIAGAEARINAFPRLGYDWAIRYADRPITSPRQSKNAARTEAALEYLTHPNRTAVRS